MSTRQEIYFHHRGHRGHRERQKSPWIFSVISVSSREQGERVVKSIFLDFVSSA